MKYSSFPIIFFSQLQAKIPIDLNIMGLYYKNCHSHLPWAAQQQSSTGRALALWKAQTRTSKQPGVPQPMCSPQCPHRELSTERALLESEEIIAIPWHGLVQKWGKRFMFWFDQSALHIWCKILISCSTEIYTMSKGKYSAPFMLFSLGWESWRMTNSARFLLHLFPNESSLTGVAFAHRALLVRGVIFSPFYLSIVLCHQKLKHRGSYTTMSGFASVPYCIQGTDRSCIISDSYSFFPL